MAELTQAIPVRLDPSDIDTIVHRCREIYESAVPQYLTEQEAAAVLRLESHVLRDARRRGEISYSRVGKQVRYSRQDIDAMRVATKKPTNPGQG